jgi:hypothetical protein
MLANKNNKPITIGQAYFKIIIGTVFIILCTIMAINGDRNAHIEESNLVEITNKLDHYYIYENGKGKRHIQATIFVLDNGSRYRTNLVNKNTAPEIFKQKGDIVKFYANPNSVYPRIDGSIPAYGLWINGNEIGPLDFNSNNKRHEIIILELFCVLLFGAIILVGVSQIKKIRKEQADTIVVYDQQNINTPVTATTNEDTPNKTIIKLLLLFNIILNASIVAHFVSRSSGIIYYIWCFISFWLAMLTTYLMIKFIPKRIAVYTISVPIVLTILINIFWRQ